MMQERDADHIRVTTSGKMKGYIGYAMRRFEVRETRSIGGAVPWRSLPSSALLVCCLGVLSCARSSLLLNPSSSQQQEGPGKITVTATGAAIVTAVGVVEMLKRRLPGLHQVRLDARPVAIPQQQHDTETHHTPILPTTSGHAHTPHYTATHCIAC